MKDITSIPFLFIIIIAIIVVVTTTTLYLIKIKKQKRSRKENSAPNIIQIYREKEHTLRQWYSIIAGMDSVMLCVSILCNAIAIILSQFNKVDQNIVMIFMILTLVSNSIRNGFNFPQLRKPYIKATRHLELAIDECEYTHEKKEKQIEKDLHKAYCESQEIIENFFE